MRVLAIDPGTTESGWIIIENNKIIKCGIDPNEWIKAAMHDWDAGFLAIEMIACYGMPVGKETFETCVWIGRFLENWSGEHRIVFRKNIKKVVCRNPNAKDPDIRKALIQKFGEAGTASNPGPTYGVKSHIWAALAVAVTALEQ
jgi:hypothetical protein